MTKRPPSPARVLLISGVLVVVALVPVAVAFSVAGAILAQSVYIGIVMMTSTVRTLPLRAQAWSAVWVAVVATVGAGVAAAGSTALLFIALAGVCLVQMFFMRLSVQALAVAPGILVYNAVVVPPGHVWEVSVGTAVGAAFLILAARVARVKQLASPLDPRIAAVQAVLLAVGCCLVLLITQAAGVDRAHWGVLAFCLVFVPGGSTGALRYVGATAVGAVAAALICLTDWQWAVLVAIAIAAVATVALTLLGDTRLAVIPLTATVLLLGSLTGVSSAAHLGGERTLLALVAALLALAFAAASSWGIRRLSPIAIES